MRSARLATLLLTLSALAALYVGTADGGPPVARQRGRSGPPLVSSGLADIGPPVVRQRGRSGAPPAPSELLTHDQSVTSAAADIAKLPRDGQLQSRYLSLYNLTYQERLRCIMGLSFLCYSLSRSRTIDGAGVTIVPDTDLSLVRLNTVNFQFHDDNNKSVGWNPKTWDKLGELDVYFSSVKIKVEQEVVVDRIPKRKLVPTNPPRYTTSGELLYEYKDVYDEVKKEGQPKQSRVRDMPDYVNPVAFAALQNATQSQYPILRADFFLYHAALPPFYYDFLEFGDKVEDFYKALFADEKELSKAQLDIKGIVVRSGAGMEGKVIPVSELNRFLARQPSLYGYIWRSKDVAKADKLNNFLRKLSDDEFDASEWIATARNGLQWYFLSNRQNARQDEAPIAIVRDNTNTDRRVRNGRSCITCHVRGLNEFMPLPQEMVKQNIDIVSPDPIKAKKLREAFITNVDEFVEQDNKIYAAAVRKATTFRIDGEIHYLDSEENANNFGFFHSRFIDTPVTIQIASREVGMPVKDLMAVLAGAKNDPFLLNLSRNDPRLAVPRVYWEESYQQAMILVSEARKRNK